MGYMRTLCPGVWLEGDTVNVDAARLCELGGFPATDENMQTMTDAAIEALKERGWLSKDAQVHRVVVEDN